MTGETPAPNATDVPTTTQVAATFSTAVQPSSITFTLKDSSGNPISTGAINYNAATNTATVTPITPLSASTSYSATITATDTSGNAMAAPFSWSFTTAAVGTGPFSLWSNSVTPTNASANDPNANELGVKFRSDYAGYVTGIRFYKGAGNTGTHVGHLWSSTGTLLATATFSGETATGWQQVSFATPVAIAANTTYIASYYAPTGGYAYDSRYFASAGANNGPLHALADGVDGGNGVYAYGSGGNFPTSSYNATNYWVDVVYTTGPVVTSQTPAPSAPSAAVTTAVTATFSASMLPTTIIFTLTDSSGNTVPAVSINYNTATNTATLTPSASLTPGMIYTATVSGGTDTSGNSMTTDSWSFSTATSNATIWGSTATPTNPSASDTGANELGVKFRSDLPGYITGIRFYKGAGNTGTHIGHLWTASGTLLATATFSGETATGWQQVSFGTPVAIAANTVYVASYYDPSGGYSYDQNYFATSGVDNGPLHAAGRRSERWKRGLRLRVGRDVPHGVLPVDQLLGRCRLQHDRAVQAMKASNGLLTPSQGPTVASSTLSQPLSSTTPRAVDVVTSKGSISLGDTFKSHVLDRDKGEKWESIYWQANLAPGMSLIVEIRGGNTPQPDSTWSNWTAVNNGVAVPIPSARYLKYRVRLNSSVPVMLPVDFTVWTTSSVKRVAAPPNPIQTIHSMGSADVGDVFKSSVLDAGKSAVWGAISWTGQQPNGSVRVVEVRTGNNPTPDSTWSDWTPVGNGGGVPTAGRYLRYRTVLLTAGNLSLPVPFDISITTIASAKTPVSSSQAIATVPPSSSSPPTTASTASLATSGSGVVASAIPPTSVRVLVSNTSSSVAADPSAVSPVSYVGQAVTGGTVSRWPTRRPTRFWSSTPAATMYRQLNPRYSPGPRIKACGWIRGEPREMLADKSHAIDQERFDFDQRRRAGGSVAVLGRWSVIDGNERDRPDRQPRSFCALRSKGWGDRADA